MIVRLSTAFLLLTVSAQAAEWSTYSNPRFGVSIDVPPDL